MKKIWIIVIFFLVLSFGSQAQNTTISGKIFHTSMVNKIELKISQRHINGSTQTYETQVQDDDTFTFQIQVDYPQIVKLVYSRNVLEFYVEPNGKIYLEGDAHRFPYGVKFGDNSDGANNACLLDYKKKFPKHKNQFEYTQYRSGLYWYIVPPKINDMMLRMSKLAFAESMKAREHNRLKFIETFDDANGKRLSPTFKQYITDEIKYEHAYYMYCFGDVFKNKHYVKQDFFDKVNPIVFNKEQQLGGYFYREFMKAYINHEYMKLHKNDVNGIINKQYDLAAQYLQGKDLAFFRSEIIAKALYAKKVDVILDKYNDFLLNNTYYDYNEKITQAYQKAIKYHIGSPAPPFQLTTQAGEPISLSALRGKPVFLNFWASWCHSCMKKMDEMKALQSEMKTKGMVFIHVSFDRDKEKWANAIIKRGYEGTHVFLAGGLQTSLAKDYNVRALPQYYLIDKQGKFAKTPIKNDLKDMRKVMEALTKRQ